MLHWDPGMGIGLQTRQSSVILPIEQYPISHPSDADGPEKTHVQKKTELANLT